MEYTIKNAPKRWLNEGRIKLGERVKMFELKKNEYFWKDGTLCRANVISKPYASWHDVELTEHSTEKTMQVVSKVIFVEA